MPKVRKLSETVFTDDSDNRAPSSRPVEAVSNGDAHLSISAAATQSSLRSRLETTLNAQAEDRLSATSSSPMAFPCYPAYKDSSIEWLDQIPTHWLVQVTPQGGVESFASTPIPYEFFN